MIASQNIHNALWCVSVGTASDGALVCNGNGECYDVATFHGRDVAESALRPCFLVRNRATSNTLKCPSLWRRTVPTQSHTPAFQVTVFHHKNHRHHPTPYGGTAVFRPCDRSTPVRPVTQQSIEIPTPVTLATSQRSDTVTIPIPVLVYHWTGPDNIPCFRRLFSPQTQRRP